MEEEARGAFACFAFVIGTTPRNGECHKHTADRRHRLDGEAESLDTLTVHQERAIHEVR